MKKIENDLINICYCLLEESIGYADFKMENVLFKSPPDAAIDDDKYHIFLGDLGGLCGNKLDNKITLTTLPYKDNKKHRENIPCDLDNKEDLENMKKTMVHGISVILIQGLEILAYFGPDTGKGNKPLSNFLKHYVYWDAPAGEKAFSWEEVVSKLKEELYQIFLSGEYRNHILEMFQGNIKLENAQRRPWQLKW